MKSMSGNDSFLARDLYQSGKYTPLIKSMFVMHMICNRLPKIDTNDQAVWNRIRVITFDSTFVSNIEDYDEDEIARDCLFPMVTNISEELKVIVNALAWYLIDILSKYNASSPDRIIPDRVLVATNAYQKFLITNFIVNNLMVNNFVKMSFFNLEYIT